MSPGYSFSKTSLLIYGAPLFVILSSVLITQTSLFWQAPDALALGVTYDLALTSPLLYLFLIRNKPIPKTTAVPFFLGGLVLASFLLPENFHFHLDLLKTFLLPVVELSLFVVLLIKTRQTIREFRHSPNQQDFLSSLRYSAIKTSGMEWAGNIVASEIAMLYYSLFCWRKLPKASDSSFSYHRQSGTPALYGALVLLLIVETLAVHIILHLWSPLTAWILTLSSIYTIIFIVGHLKACMYRPIVLLEDRLIIRCGITADAEIPFSSIASVSATNNSLNEKEGFQLPMLKGIEPTNMEIKLHEPVVLSGMYGMRKSVQTLLLFVDQNEKFLTTISPLIKKI